MVCCSPTDTPFPLIVKFLKQNPDRGGGDIPSSLLRWAIVWDHLSKSKEGLEGSTVWSLIAAFDNILFCNISFFWRNRPRRFTSRHVLMSMAQRQHECCVFGRLYEYESLRGYIQLAGRWSMKFFSIELLAHKPPSAWTFCDLVSSTVCPNKCKKPSTWLGYNAL